MIRSAPNAPAHLLLGDLRHGVTRYAAQVAAACGAVVLRGPGDVTGRVRGRAVHLHLTDRLLGHSPGEAAEAVEDLARRVHLSVTVHDVPQPTDGSSFPDRAAAYRRMIAAVRGWATNSEHERALMMRWSDPATVGAVVPLPVLADARPAARSDPEPVLGVFGFVYPGKGHRQVVRAAAALRRADVAASVLVAGGPAAGHRDEADDLVALARARGVPLRMTGHLPEEQVAEVLRSVAVPVVAHRNVSASGSLNSWLAAGRRPLVRDGAYAREMAALRRGTMTLFRDETLVETVLATLRRPHTSWLAPDADLRPLLDDTVRGYREWWAGL